MTGSGKLPRVPTGNSDTGMAGYRLREVRRPEPVAFALGIDPGPIPGIVLLHLAGGGKLGKTAEIFQCNAATAPWLLRQLLGKDGIAGGRARCGMEAFAPGRGPGARMQTGKVTRDQVEELAGICAEHDVPVSARNAGMVKPWAEGNDWKRLRACGLYDLTAGSTHARSAAAQALYCAVWDCGYPDPVSRQGGSGS